MPIIWSIDKPGRADGAASAPSGIGDSCCRYWSEMTRFDDFLEDPSLSIRWIRVTKTVGGMRFNTTTKRNCSQRGALSMISRSGLW
jgi:hypothetical protein